MRTATVGLVLVLAGCGTKNATTTPSDTVVAADSSDVAVAEDVPAADVPSADVSATGDAADCGKKPTDMCAQGCGSDYLHDFECVGGQWKCPATFVPMQSCPAGTCWGGPTAGEECGPNGWECHPEKHPGVFGGCPDLMCPECTGFVGPQTEEGCTCECTGNEVHCKKTAPPPDCNATSESSLDGAKIQVQSTDCTFTLAEAAKGIEIAYSVEVAQDIEGVISKPGDAGSCAQPGPSGLYLFERLDGGDQNYCICDEGLCMAPTPKAATLKKGSYPSTFKWDGVNWYGPSDTGNPKGKPFPPGTYTLHLTSTGSTDVPGGPNPFQMTGTATVTITP